MSAFVAEAAEKRFGYQLAEAHQDPSLRKGGQPEAQMAVKYEDYKMKIFCRDSLRKVLFAFCLVFAGTVIRDLAGGGLSLTTRGQHGRPVHRSLIAKISMLYGERNELYERALATHDAHNVNFGYEHYVLRRETMSGYWSKPAYILRLILSELEKPDDERLAWLCWMDGDVVVMNPKIPLEVFIPPEQGWSHVHAVVTNDHRGLNNGVFFLRVHPWSAKLMAAVLNTETHDPNMVLDFADQSALQYWLHNREEFRKNTIHVPQRWFNAYAGYRGSADELIADPMQPSYKFKANSIKEGDLLVHHAGHKSLRAERMWPWVEAAEKHLSAWELDYDQTTYADEVAQFWKNDAKNERKVVDDMIKVLNDLAAKKKLAVEKKAAEDKKKRIGKRRQ